MVGEERVTGVFYEVRGDIPGVRVTFVTVEDQRRYPHLCEVRHQGITHRVPDAVPCIVNSEDIPIDVIAIREHSVASFEVDYRIVAVRHRSEEGLALFAGELNPLHFRGQRGTDSLHIPFPSQFLHRSPITLHIVDGCLRAVRFAVPVRRWEGLGMGKPGQRVVLPGFFDSCAMAIVGDNACFVKLPARW